MSAKEKITQIEEIIFKDPGNRGISSLFQPNSLHKSSELILKTLKTKKSYILTGFCCLSSSSETDGPLGSSLINATLNNLGFNNFLLTDPFSEKVVKASSNNGKIVIENSYENFLENHKESDISFIVSCERPGRSLKNKDYRTMRAKNISHQNCNLDLLFPGENETKSYLTIGIGDGGNECGTGNIADQVAKVVKNGEDICTDRFSDVLIMVGVSNWGAIALAAALVIVSNDSKGAEVFLKECADQKNILEKMIEYGSYDGITGKYEPSIDGMLFDNEHLAITNAIVEILKSVLNIP